MGASGWKCWIEIFYISCLPVFVDSTLDTSSDPYFCPRWETEAHEKNNLAVNNDRKFLIVLCKKNEWVPFCHLFVFWTSFKMSSDLLMFWNTLQLELIHGQHWSRWSNFSSNRNESLMKSDHEWCITPDFPDDVDTASSPLLLPLIPLEKVENALHREIGCTFWNLSSQYVAKVGTLS